MVVPGRFAGTTDVLIAGLGGWLGAFVSRSMDEIDKQGPATQGRI
jgi:hypothetical protein